MFWWPGSQVSSSMGSKGKFKTKLVWKWRLKACRGPGGQRWGGVSPGFQGKKKKGPRSPINQTKRAVQPAFLSSNPLVLPPPTEGIKHIQGVLRRFDDQNDQNTWGEGERSACLDYDPRHMSTEEVEGWAFQSLFHFHPTIFQPSQRTRHAYNNTPTHPHTHTHTYACSLPSSLPHQTEWKEKKIEGGKRAGLHPTYLLL